MEPAQAEQLRKTLGHVFGQDEDSGRPGSAPPQMIDDTAGRMYKASFFNGLGHAQGSLETGPSINGLFGLSESKVKEQLSLSDPDYVRYYYANRNINPRLPPPVLSSGQRGLLWNAGKSLDTSVVSIANDQPTSDQPLHGKELSMLFHDQVGLKDSNEAGSFLIPKGVNKQLGGSASQMLFGGSEHLASSASWASPNESPNLDSLLQVFSPSKNPLFASLDESTSLHEKTLFSGGSNSHSPRHSLMGNQHFDATVGSPPQRSNSAIACLGSQDPKVVLRRKQELTQSKLRMASSATDPPSPLLDPVTAPPAPSAAAINNGGPDVQASALTEALKGLPQNLLPAMLPGMSTEQQAAAALASSMPTADMAALINAGTSAGMSSQLQAMYMASMYPFYAQQAAAMQFPFMGIPGVPPMMGFPGGYPMMGFPGMNGMNSMMPDMRSPGFSPMMPGAAGFPGMPHSPFPGMNGINGMGIPGAGGPQDFTAYYHKVFEAQAATAMAAAAMSASPDMLGLDSGAAHQIGIDHGFGGEMEGPKRMQGRGANNNFNTAGNGGLPPNHHPHNSYKNLAHVANGDSPLRRRDQHNGQQGRGSFTHDSPTRRHYNSGEAATGGGGGSARKVSRREADDKKSDGMLEEFKMNKSRKFELPDIFGHVYDFSLDQHGSRFIQQKLETAVPEHLTVALEEVLPRMLTLVTDVFGNYVVQKFLEHGTAEQRMKLYGMLQGHVLHMSLQMYGCRVVQKAIEVLPTEVQCQIMSELDGQVMRCVRDQNGNHVVQKIIECLPTDRILHLLDSFLTCVVPLSSHPFGCRVIQRILEHCKDERRRSVVMDDILNGTCQLAQDQYGNYVIQHVLEHGTASERMQIVTQLAPLIVPMSMHKFASNVVEKCLIFCSTAERDVLIRSMLGSPEDPSLDEDPLQQMMKDQFGNYVVQRVLELCDDVQRELLLSRVRLQLHALKKYTYGKHIVARVEKLLATGTKLQSSSKLSCRLLPNDTELQVLQQQLTVMHLQHQKQQMSLDNEEHGSILVDAKIASSVDEGGVDSEDGSPGSGSGTPGKEGEAPKRLSSEAGVVEERAVTGFN